MAEEFKFKAGDKVYIIYSYQHVPTYTHTIKSVSGKRGDITIEGFSNKFRQDGSQICDGYRGDRLILWTPELEQEYKAEAERMKLAGEVQIKLDNFCKSPRFRNEKIERLKALDEALSKYPFIPKQEGE